MDGPSFRLTVRFFAQLVAAMCEFPHNAATQHPLTLLKTHQGIDFITGSETFHFLIVMT